jgi:putative membrane protein
MLKYAVAVVCLFAMAFTSSSVLAANDQGMLTNKDKKFIHEAAIGGREEVALGKLATQKASSPDVKQFGQRMVDDHSKANDQLEQLAKNKSVDLSMNKDKTDKRSTSSASTTALTSTSITWT